MGKHSKEDLGSDGGETRASLLHGIVADLQRDVPQISMMDLVALGHSGDHSNEERLPQNAARSAGAAATNAELGEEWAIVNAGHALRRTSAVQYHTHVYGHPVNDPTMLLPIIKQG